MGIMDTPFYYRLCHERYNKKHNLNLSYDEWFEKSKWILPKLGCDFKKKQREKIKCECGAFVNYSGLSKHKKTKKHLAAVK